MARRRRRGRSSRSPRTILPHLERPRAPSVVAEVHTARAGAPSEAAPNNQRADRRGTLLRTCFQDRTGTGRGVNLMLSSSSNRNTQTKQQSKQQSKKQSKKTNADDVHGFFPSLLICSYSARSSPPLCFHLQSMYRYLHLQYANHQYRSSRLGQLFFAGESDIGVCLFITGGGRPDPRCKIIIMMFRLAVVARRRTATAMAASPSGRAAVRVPRSWPLRRRHHRHDDAPKERSGFPPMDLRSCETILNVGYARQQATGSK